MKTVVALVALILVSSAQAANIATPKMEEVASWAAQKPVRVHCEDDREEWARIIASHANGWDPSQIQGFVTRGTSTVHIGPWACEGLSRGLSSYSSPEWFAISLHILLHEATHARGWTDEAHAECAARVLIYSALHNFYGILPFTELKRQLVGWALAFSLSAGPQYQRGGCARL